MRVKIKLSEEMLGTKASNPDVFSDFIASKHPSGTPQRDELDNAEHREEAGTTVFHRNKDKEIGIYDYQIKGFFKDACGAMNRFDKEHRGGLEKLSAYKSKIDGAIFVFPRFIKIQLPEGNEAGVCERPLRAETAQGPRVSVCKSETVPAGSTIEFEVQILAKDLRPYVKAWLEYGKLRGLGQWRNSGKGRFEFEILQEDKAPAVDGEESPSKGKSKAEAAESEAKLSEGKAQAATLSVGNASLGSEPQGESEAKQTEAVA